MAEGTHLATIAPTTTDAAKFAGADSGGPSLTKVTLGKGRYSTRAAAGDAPQPQAETAAPVEGTAPEVAPLPTPAEALADLTKDVVTTINDHRTAAAIGEGTHPATDGRDTTDDSSPDADAPSPAEFPVPHVNEQTTELHGTQVVSEEATGAEQLAATTDSPATTTESGRDGDGQQATAETDTDKALASARSMFQTVGVDPLEVSPEDLIREWRESGLITTVDDERFVRDSLGLVLTAEGRTPPEPIIYTVTTTGPNAETYNYTPTQLRTYLSRMGVRLDATTPVEELRYTHGQPLDQDDTARVRALREYEHQHDVQTPEAPSPSTGDELSPSTSAVQATQEEPKEPAAQRDVYNPATFTSVADYVSYVAPDADVDQIVSDYGHYMQLVEEVDQNMGTPNEKRLVSECSALFQRLKKAGIDPFMIGALKDRPASAPSVAEPEEKVGAPNDGQAQAAALTEPTDDITATQTEIDAVEDRVIGTSPSGRVFRESDIVASLGSLGVTDFSEDVDVVTSRLVAEGAIDPDEVPLLTEDYITAQQYTDRVRQRANAQADLVNQLDTADESPDQTVDHDLGLDIETPELVVDSNEPGIKATIDEGRQSDGFLDSDDIGLEIEHDDDPIAYDSPTNPLHESDLVRHFRAAGIDDFATPVEEVISRLQAAGVILEDEDPDVYREAYGLAQGYVNRTRDKLNAPLDVPGLPQFVHKAHNDPNSLVHASADFLTHHDEDAIPRFLRSTQPEEAAPENVTPATEQTLDQIISKVPEEDHEYVRERIDNLYRLQQEAQADLGPHLRQENERQVAQLRRYLGRDYGVDVDAALQARQRMDSTPTSLPESLSQRDTADATPERQGGLLDEWQAAQAAGDTARAANAAQLLATDFNIQDPTQAIAARGERQRPISPLTPVQQETLLREWDRLENDINNSDPTVAEPARLERARLAQVLRERAGIEDLGAAHAALPQARINVERPLTENQIAGMLRTWKAYETDPTPEGRAKRVEVARLLTQRGGLTNLETEFQNLGETVEPITLTVTREAAQQVRQWHELTEQANAPLPEPPANPVLDDPTLNERVHELQRLRTEYNNQVPTDPEDRRSISQEVAKAVGRIANEMEARLEASGLKQGDPGYSEERQRLIAEYQRQVSELQTAHDERTSGPISTIIALEDELRADGVDPTQALALVQEKGDEPLTRDEINARQRETEEQQRQEARARAEALAQNLQVDHHIDNPDSVYSTLSPVQQMGEWVNVPPPPKPSLLGQLGREIGERLPRIPRRLRPRERTSSEAVVRNPDGTYRVNPDSTASTIQIPELGFRERIHDELRRGLENLTTNAGVVRAANILQDNKEVIAGVGTRLLGSFLVTQLGTHVDMTSVHGMITGIDNAMTVLPILRIAAQGDSLRYLRQMVIDSRPFKAVETNHAGAAKWLRTASLNAADGANAAAKFGTGWVGERGLEYMANSAKINALSQTRPVVEPPVRDNYAQEAHERTQAAINPVDEFRRERGAFRHDSHAGDTLKPSIGDRVNQGLKSTSDMASGVGDNMKRTGEDLGHKGQGWVDSYKKGTLGEDADMMKRDWFGTDHDGKGFFDRIGGQMGQKLHDVGESFKGLLHREQEAAPTPQPTAPKAETATTTATATSTAEPATNTPNQTTTATATPTPASTGTPTPAASATTATPDIAAATPAVATSQAPAAQPPTSGGTAAPTTGITDHADSAYTARPLNEYHAQALSHDNHATSPAPSGPDQTAAVVAPVEAPHAIEHSFRAGTGVQVHGSLSSEDGKLYYGNSEWKIVENGERVANRLMDMVGMHDQVVDDKMMRQQLDKAIDLWGQGKLDHNSDLGKLFDASNGNNPSLQRDPATMDAMKHLGIVHAPVETPPSAVQPSTMPATGASNAAAPNVQPQHPTPPAAPPAPAEPPAPPAPAAEPSAVRPEVANTVAAEVPIHYPEHTETRNVPFYNDSTQKWDEIPNVPTKAYEVVTHIPYKFVVPNVPDTSYNHMVGELTQPLIKPFALSPEATNFFNSHMADFLHKHGSATLKPGDTMDFGIDTRNTVRNEMFNYIQGIENVMRENIAKNRDLYTGVPFHFSLEEIMKMKKIILLIRNYAG